MSEKDESSSREEQAVAKQQPERVWEQGWQGHKDAQLLRVANLSLEEKLDWLEDVHKLVLALSANGNDKRQSD